MIGKRWALAALGAAFVVGAGSMALAGVVVITAQANDLAVIKVASASGDNVAFTGSEEWEDVPGAVRRATSTGTGNLFVADFFAESECDDQFGCDVRIIVKDLAGSHVAVMNPDSESFQFDQLDGSSHFQVEQAHAIRRSISGLAAGTYDFQVQFKVQMGGGFVLGFWHLTLARYT